MLLTFTSKGAPDVLMYKEHAKPVLALLNKDLGIGVITAGEAAAAIARLEVAMVEERVHAAAEAVHRDVMLHHGPDGTDNEHEPPDLVAFSARIFPLLEMLRAAHRGGHDIVWGIA